MGEIALGRILAHVEEVGDAAESRYLEIKSELDPGSKLGRVKIAKFLLGMANRMPEIAMRQFQGYGVMVIGAAQGGALGIPSGTEAHDLANALRTYVGSDFPAFELMRLSMGNDREVLFIIAPPPVAGQPIYPCRKQYQPDATGDKGSGIENGAIYVRGSSDSRPANAGEIDDLVRRARANNKPPMNIDVKVEGAPTYVHGADELIDLLYDRHEQNATTPKRSGGAGLLGSMAFLDYSPERLAAWRRERPANMQNGRDYFIGAALTGISIRVISRGRFVQKPSLRIVFSGCEALRSVESARYSAVVPVIENEITARLRNASTHNLESLRRRDDPMRWTNEGDDAVVTIEPDSFRPDSEWSSRSDDFVLRVLAPREHVLVSWTLTEEGNDTVTSGELPLPAEGAMAIDLYNGVVWN